MTKRKIAGYSILVLFAAGLFFGLAFGSSFLVASLTILISVVLAAILIKAIDLIC